MVKENTNPKMVVYLKEIFKTVKGMDLADSLKINK
jgi:hypothetical protein